MNAQNTKLFTPARIVALALIAVAVAGLTYLRFAPDAEPVSVPAGAKAGDLVLESCKYTTEDGAYDADCGTLVVPENRGSPQSRLIALPVTRIRSTSAHPTEPVFRLEGGPGKTNMDFAAAGRLLDKHDVVLVGYRGVDGSSRLDCPEVVSALKHSTDFLDPKAQDARAGGFRKCAARLQADGVDLDGYTLPQRVDDLEAARRALGYERVDLVSESLGTRTAMIYAWRYPKSVHRSAMIAVNPPGHFVWNAETTEKQIGRYSALCAKDESCSSRTGDLAASMRSTSADMPSRFWFLPIKQGNVRLTSFFGMMESTSEGGGGPLFAPATIDSWLSAAKGDASGFWFQSLGADLIFPGEQVWGEVAAAAMTDRHAAERYFGSPRPATILGDAGTEFYWGGGRLLDAWPSNPGADQYTKVQTSNVETLLIGGTLDFATPVENATRELLPHLPNGRQVVLSELGHSGTFWTYQPEASTRLLTTFFDTGKADRSLYAPAKVDFTPDVPQVGFAKVLASVMIAFAAVTILSLLWLPLRVLRRGRFGRKSGAVLRSAFPVVLGLGGWFAGSLIVLTAFPTVPLDDELLAVCSVGVPVGLGIYWAWFRRGWSPGVKWAGLAAAAAGSLAGAWLGFHATTGMIALATAIVGAIAGANLALILLDTRRAWSTRDGRAAETTVPGPSREPATPAGVGAR